MRVMHDDGSKNFELMHTFMRYCRSCKKKCVYCFLSSQISISAIHSKASNKLNKKLEEQRCQILLVTNVSLLFTPSFYSWKHTLHFLLLQFVSIFENPWRFTIYKNVMKYTRVYVKWPYKLAEKN